MAQVLSALGPGQLVIPQLEEPIMTKLTACFTPDSTQDPVTMKDVKAKVRADSYSRRGDVFTVRRGFFYRHGKDHWDFATEVKEAFPYCLILDHGEVCKDFNGAASVRNSSHWWVKFTFED